jgi:hypothetical protein
LLDYIWLDDKSPILNQLPNNFKEAAILPHSFVQMPTGWKQTKQIDSKENYYPTDEEILNQGNRVLWKTVINESGLESFEELELALKTSIYALKKKFERIDLANKLNANLKSKCYYTTEEQISLFLIEDLLKILGPKGAEKIYFSETIFDQSGVLKIKDITPLDICKLSNGELIITTDENMDYAFMSVYDSFYTLFFSKRRASKKL